MAKKLTALCAIATILLSGCSGKVQKESNKPKKKVLEWIATCQSNSGSSECLNEIQRIQAKWSPGNQLLAWIPLWSDPRKSQACTADEDSSACLVEIAADQNSVSNLVCFPSSTDEFGGGNFCYAKILFKNVSSSPFDDWIDFALWDKTGAKFASDVDGTFTIGTEEKQFASSLKVSLNPGLSGYVHVGFSVNQLSTPFTTLIVSNSDNSFYARIPLCATSNNQFIGDEGVGVKIYEDARWLESCNYVNSTEFVSK